MCLILTGLKQHFTPDIIERAIKHNPHGVGIFGNGIAAKGLWGPERVIKYLNSHKDGTEVAFHARLATHGAITQRNCHPFEVRLRRSRHPAYLMHNGVLPLGSPGERGRSDSAHLADLLSGRYTLEELVDILGTIDGKFALGHRDIVVPINDHRWHEVNELLASNGQLSPVPLLRSPWQWHHAD